MQLTGKLDSPFVRRVAIAMTLMELPFTHNDLSVFRDLEAFRALNPVVKAPTLVTDDGVTLMESGLIIEYLERIAPARSLHPRGQASFLAAQRIVGLALAACEKTVAIVYERQLRPPEKQHAPWMDRVLAQLRAAYAQLEEALAPEGPWLFGTAMTHADVITAVAWRFTNATLPGLLPAEAHPRLAAFAAAAEAEQAFLKVQPGSALPPPA